MPPLLFFFCIDGVRVCSAERPQSARYRPRACTARHAPHTLPNGQQPTQKRGARRTLRARCALRTCAPQHALLRAAHADDPLPAFPRTLRLAHVAARRADGFPRRAHVGATLCHPLRLSDRAAPPRTSTAPRRHPLPRAASAPRRVARTSAMSLPPRAMVGIVRAPLRAAVVAVLTRLAAHIAPTAPSPTHRARANGARQLNAVHPGSPLLAHQARPTPPGFRAFCTILVHTRRECAALRAARAAQPRNRRRTHAHHTARRHLRSQPSAPCSILGAFS